MPAEDASRSGPPMIRGNRMYCAWWGGGISIIDCAACATSQLVGIYISRRRFLTTTPAGRSAMSLVVVTDEAAPGEILRQPVGLSMRASVPAGRSRPSFRTGKIFRPARPVRRPQYSGKHRDRRPWTNIIIPTYFNAGLRAVDVSDVLRPRRSAASSGIAGGRTPSSRTTSAPTSTAGSI